MTECNAVATAPAPQPRVGIGGWTYPPWRGAFYPEGLPQREELAFASRQLGVIEINGTFYRNASPARFAAWGDATPNGFVFAVKGPRVVTHRHALADAGEAITRFLASGPTELGDKLGPFLWQLPPSCVFDAADLRAFLALLPRRHGGISLRHAIEARHDSFMQPEWLALARRHGVACVFTDAPDLPSYADTTSDFVYARLMNASERRKAGYTPRALDGWARTCRAWARGDAPGDLPYIEERPRVRVLPRDVYVLFINGFKPRAPAAAQALQARLVPGHQPRH